MSEWNKVKLGTCIKEINEKTTKNNQYEVLSVTKDGIFSQEEFFKKQIASENNIGYKVIRRNNLVFSTMNLWMGSLDVLTNYDIGIVSPAYKVFEFNEKLMLPEYGNYFMKSYYMIEQYKNCSEQGASVVRRNLDLKALLKIEINIPPIEEQEKIVKILRNIDSILSRLSLYIENITFEKMDIIDKILINSNYIEKTFNQLLDEKVIEDIMDGNHGELHPKTSDYVNDGIPFVMANNIHDGMLDISNCNFLKKEQTDKLRKGFSKAGDILLTHKGTIGNVGYVPEKIKYDYIMLTPQVTYYRVNKCNKILTKEFLYYYLQSTNFQKTLKLLSIQSTRAYIGITEQKKLKIKIPSLEVQEQASKVLIRMDRKINIMKAKKQNYENLKKALMQKLLTGKVRVKI